MRTKLTSVCLAVIMMLSVLTVAPFTVSAAEENIESISATSGDFEYEVLDDGTASIIGYNGSATELEIPSTLDGYTVTEIGNFSFGNCWDLTSISIPDSIKSIGFDAFLGCSITSVTIPPNVQYIGWDAFGYVYDYDLQTVKLDDFTIYGYTNSQAQIYARDNGFTFVSIGEVLDTPFYYKVSSEDKKEAIIIKYRGSDADVTIPSVIDGYTVTEIANNAFENCTSLESVTIPDTVSYIGYSAFADCTSLANINIPDSVSYIGGGAFYGTKWYENQPDGIVYIGDFAYAYKGEMPANTSLEFKKGTKGIVESAFQDCENLTSVTIPDSVRSIDYYAFGRCTNLKSITIPASVTEIGTCAIGYIEICVAPGYYVDVVDKDFTIYGYAGTEAERYAVFNDIKFISLGDAPAPTLGDVNGDGELSIDDVTDIQKYIATIVEFTNEQESLADVDRDGRITIDDVTLIQKSLAGLAVIE